MFYYLFHIPILRKGRETVIYSLLIHIALTVFSLLTVFFFPGMPGVTLISGNWLSVLRSRVHMFFF